jgi:hypothetical protein
MIVNLITYHTIVSQGVRQINTFPEQIGSMKGVDYKPGSVIENDTWSFLWMIRLSTDLLRPTWVKGWAILITRMGDPLFGLASDGVCQAT